MAAGKGPDGEPKGQVPGQPDGQGADLSAGQQDLVEALKQWVEERGLDSFRIEYPNRRPRNLESYFIPPISIEDKPLIYFQDTNDDGSGLRRSQYDWHSPQLDTFPIIFTPPSKIDTNFFHDRYDILREPKKDLGISDPFPRLSELKTAVQRVLDENIERARTRLAEELAKLNLINFNEKSDEFEK